MFCPSFCEWQHGGGACDGDGAIRSADNVSHVDTAFTSKARFHLSLLLSGQCNVSHGVDEQVAAVAKAEFKEGNGLGEGCIVIEEVHEERPGQWVVGAVGHRGSGGGDHVSSVVLNRRSGQRCLVLEEVSVAEVADGRLVANQSVDEHVVISGLLSCTEALLGFVKNGFEEVLVSTRSSVWVGQSDLCVRARCVEFGPLVSGVVAVAVGRSSRHVKSCGRQFCGRLSGEHPAELVCGQAAHAVDTGFSCTAFLHDDGEAVHSNHDLSCAAGGVANEAVHGVAIVRAIGFRGLPVSGHVANVDRGSLGGVGANAASTGGRTARFDGDGDAVAGFLVVFSPCFGKG